MAVPLPGTPHAAKVVLGYLRGGQQMINTFYVKDPSDAIFSDIPTFLTAVKNEAVTNLLPAMWNDCALNLVGFEDIRTVPFGGLTVGVTPPVAGTRSTSGNFPNNISVAIKRATGNLGRSGRGRLYWPSMDTGALSDDNTVSGGFAGDVTVALEAFQAGVEAYLAGLTMGIVSYYLDKVLRTEGLFQGITSWSVSDLIVDQQRRRLPGRGR